MAVTTGSVTGDGCMMEGVIFTGGQAGTQLSASTFSEYSLNGSLLLNVFQSRKNIPPHLFVESRKGKFFPLLEYVEGPCKQTHTNMTTPGSLSQLTFLRSSEINKQTKKNLHFLSLWYLKYIFF